MEKNQKNNSQDFDFSVVEDKIQQVQNIIEKAVKSKDYDSDNDVLINKFVKDKDGKVTIVQEKLSK